MFENAKDILDFTASALLEATFKFHIIEEGHLLATFIAQTCPNPNLAIVGISEIFINAVEHGNLNISYLEKTSLQREGKWIEEINKRMLCAENKDKHVTVIFKRSVNCIKLRIKDCGKGFDWKKYTSIDKKRSHDNHGRGIAMATSLTFQSVEYFGNGNEVECTIAW
jgi:anti-sigma regulatory factor (Ser/Thr protein kinase)